MLEALHLLLGVGLHPRYFTGALPPLLLLLAAGAGASLASEMRRLAAAALLVLMAWGTALHLGNPGHGRENIRDATAWLEMHVPPGAPILVTSDEMAELARFHSPARRFELYPPRRVKVAKADADRWAATLPFSGQPRAFYVVGREWRSDPDGALRAALSHRYASCGGTKVEGIRIMCLMRTPALPAGTRARFQSVGSRNRTPARLAEKPMCSLGRTDPPGAA